MKKNILLVMLMPFLFLSCNTVEKEQRAIIYENFETELWENITFENLNSEYTRLRDVMIDYANERIREYEISAVNKQNQAQNLFQGDEFTALLFGYDSNAEAEKAQKAVNVYKDHCTLMINNLSENLSKALACRDSIINQMDEYTDAEICNTLLGNVEKVSDLSDESQEQIAMNISLCVFNSLPRPKIAFCEYVKKDDIWKIRCDNAENQYLKFFPRDDGNWDWEFGPVNKWEGDLK